MFRRKLVSVARFLVSLIGFNEKKHILKAISKLPKNNGLCLVDVGAAGGIEKRWQSVTEDLNYHGFEPDERSFKNLNSHTNAKSSKIFPFALWSEEKEISVLLCKDPQCSSVYEPNRPFLDRFPVSERFDITDVFKCNAKRLDQIGLRGAHFIKIDIQGGELEVLKGAEGILDQSLGLEIEVEFLEMYKSQPLFGEIVKFLDPHNLEFIDFVNLRRWLPNKHTDIGHCVFGDALFLKSPYMISTGNYTQDERVNYLKILLLYRRFDLIEKFLECSEEASYALFEEFQTAIRPIQNNFKRVDKINNFVTIVLRFFGVSLKSHLIY